MPPDPVNRLQILIGLPCRFALWELVHNWYIAFLPDLGLVEMKKPIGFSNKTSTASSCAEDQILEHLIHDKISNSIGKIAYTGLARERLAWMKETVVGGNRSRSLMQA